MNTGNTPLDGLKKVISQNFPKAVFSSDPPEKPDGTHWLNVILDGKTIEIEWNPSRGFGFYANDATHGERPNLIVPSQDLFIALEAFKNRL
jgi:hypothetical protein